MKRAIERIIYKLSYNESYYGRDDAKIYEYYFESAIQLIDTLPTIMNVMQDKNEDSFSVQEIKCYPGETKWYTLEQWLQKDDVSKIGPRIEDDSEREDNDND
jgi:hypothetical protein